MTAKPHKSCFGAMLPSMLSLRTGKPVAGKAFSVFLGMPHGTVVTERRVEVDMEQWDDCRACDEFEDCYQLCTTRVALESAVNRW